MAFIVEDGSIVANANAYITVDFYRGYWTDRNVDVTDPTQTDAQIQAAIIQATQYIDNANNWKGCIVTDDQALDWPRSGVYDKDGRSIDYQSIPLEVKSAVAEYAYRSITNADGLLPDPTDTGAVKRQRDKVGSLETETEYQDGTGGYFGIKEYPAADRYIADFTRGGVYGDFGRARRC